MDYVGLQRRLRRGGKARRPGSTGRVDGESPRPNHAGASTAEVRGIACPVSILEGIAEIHTKQGKIGRIARGDLQSMNTRSSANHGISFKKMLGPACPKPGPFAKASCVHGEQVAEASIWSSQIAISRALSGFCLRVHSTPRWSSHRDSGDIDLIFPKTLEPSYDRFAEFGNDTGVQQIVNHLNSVPLRRFSAPRFGASF